MCTWRLSLFKPCLKRSLNHALNRLLRVHFIYLAEQLTEFGLMARHQVQITDHFLALWLR